MTTPCPTPEKLKTLLAAEGDATLDEGLLEHLGQCEVCQQRLVELSVDDDDDWQPWQSLIESDRLDWPTEVGLNSHPDSPHQTISESSPTIDAKTEFQPQLDETIAGDDGEHSQATPIFTRQALRGEFADYELLDKLGAGGMGVVYLARQKTADRIVALKIIRPEQLESLSAVRRQTWLDRFRSEAQAAARLEHDHVVRVYDVGEYFGTLYYSMQYIDGKSLGDIVRDDPIENRRLARLMHDVALAVDHAHQHGVLHRDLKPQNILIQQYRPAPRSGRTNVQDLRQAGRTVGQDPKAAGSTLDMASDSVTMIQPGQERPYVTDFGLAKNFEEGQQGSTHTGEVMGSPSYMSPEQAQDASRCTPASDVYSLGATLYDALTGRPPFRAASPVETLRQVIDQQPVAPRELNPSIDLDLQTITLKALEKDPSRRYESARHMADDLARYIKGEPIEARPIRRTERWIRWCRRNPTVALLTGGVAALLVIVAVGSVIASSRLRQQAELESAAREEAEGYFVMSLGVIRDMLAKFGDESLEHVPQMEQVREELLQKALDLYSELSASKPTNPKLQVEFARTQYQIANLYDLLGKHDEAKDAYTQAIGLFEELKEQSPGDPQLQFLWANSHSMLGETLRKSSPDEARFHLETAIATQKQLHDRLPDQPQYRKELSRTQNNLGLLLTETGDYVAAEQSLASAIVHLRQLSRSAGLSQERQSGLLADLGRSQINLGVLLRKLPARSTEAKPAYQDAMKNLERAGELAPDNREFRFRLAVAIVDLANVFLAEGDEGVKQALELARLATKKFFVLSEEFPGIPVYRYEQANAGNTTAVALATLENYEEASAEFELADQVLIQLQEDLPDFSRAEARFHGLKGRILGGQGFVQSALENWDQAQQLVQQAIECQQAAVKLHPENPEFASFLRQHRDFLEKLQQQKNSADQPQ